MKLISFSIVNGSKIGDSKILSLSERTPEDKIQYSEYECKSYEDAIEFIYRSHNIVVPENPNYCIPVLVKSYTLENLDSLEPKGTIKTVKAPKCWLPFLEEGRDGK